MHKRLIIIGASGHGKVILDIALKLGYTDIGFLDDVKLGEVMGYTIVGTSSEIPALSDGETEFVIAIGNNEMREKIARNNDAPWATLIHPSAQIGIGAQIGVGTVVMANSVINADATIGKHCIINTGAVVEHDNIIGDFVHISPKAALGGTVTVGAGVHIGIGASVINNVAIAAGAKIGAGAVVVRNIEESGTYIGVPARKRHNE